PAILRVFPRRQRCRAGCQSSDRLDGRRCPHDASLRDDDPGSRPAWRQEGVLRLAIRPADQGRRADSLIEQGPKRRRDDARIMGAPRYPLLYQINTRVWLAELARKLGRPATLDDIPDSELDRL